MQPSQGVQKMERHCFTQTKAGDRHREGKLGETSFGGGSARAGRNILLGEPRRRLTALLRHKLEEDAPGVTGHCYSS